MYSGLRVRGKGVGGEPSLNREKTDLGMKKGSKRQLFREKGGGRKKEKKYWFSAGKQRKKPESVWGDSWATGKWKHWPERDIVVGSREAWGENFDPKKGGPHNTAGEHLKRAHRTSSLHLPYSPPKLEATSHPVEVEKSPKKTLKKEALPAQGARNDWGQGSPQDYLLEGLEGVVKRPCIPPDGLTV